DRLDNVWLSYGISVRRFFWPTDLCVAYGMDPGAARFGILLIFPLSAATILAWRSRRHSPLAAFGWFSFLVMLFPTSGLVQTGPQFTADRYMYLPLLGLSLVIVDVFRPLAVVISGQVSFG